MAGLSDLTVQRLLAPEVRHNPTGRFCIWVIIVTIALSIVQVGMGCDPVVALLSACAIIVALVPVAVYGASHFVGVIFIFMSIYFGLAALIAKTLMGQPLSLYLYVPLKSHLILAVGALGSVIGALNAKLIARAFSLLSPGLNRNGLVPPIQTPDGLRKVAIGALLVAGVGAVLARTSGDAKALSNFMTSYFYLALAAEMARALILSSGQQVFSLPATLLTVLVTLVTISTNSKMGFLVIGVTYLTTVLAFGGRLNKGAVAAGAIGVFFLSSFLFPAVTFVARHDRDQLSPIELVGRTFEATIGLMTGDDATEKFVEDTNARSSRVAIGHYNSEYGRHMPSIVERLTIIQFVDAVVWRVPSEGPFRGISFIVDKIPDNLPKFLNPSKQESYTGHDIVWALQLVQFGEKQYQTVTLPTEAYFAGGLTCVLVLSALVYLAYSTVLGTLFGRITNNVFAIYMIARYDHFIMSGVTGNALFLFVRQLPFDLVFFAILIWSARRAPAVAVSRTRALPTPPPVAKGS